MIEYNSHLPCSNDSELVSILEQMIQDNIDITARAVIRRHPVLKAASSITRNKERSQLLSFYQNKQNELRSWHKRLGKSSTENTAKKLAEKEHRILELERQVEILTASHIALIRAVGELGGFNKWAKFFENYQSIIDELNSLRAIPNQLPPDNFTSI
jgi:hypothetical protein